ncbi:MAG: hypothetical protein K6E95_02090 [Lachnospiraceae bacterium]|nr:hypothetical protein [Lachnospiraceae bacterium]
MGELSFKESKRVNSRLLLCYLIIFAVLVAAYVMEIVKGSREPLYVVLLMMTGLVPLFVAYICYKIKPEAKRIRYIAAIGYGIFYGAILLTGKDYTYVYIFPMMFVLMLTCDTRLILTTNLLVIIANIASAVITYLDAVDKTSTLTMLEVQIAVVVVSALYSFIAIKVIKTNNEEKASALSKEKETADELVDKNSKIIQVANEKVTNVVAAASLLDENFENVQRALKEVSEGAQLTAVTAENQMSSIQELDKAIGSAKKEAQSVNDSMNNFMKTAADCTEKSKNIGDGIKTIEVETRAILKGAEALEAMALELNEIIDIISSVSKQTALLSLNASIESARAGEAGRGFAVVAGEIGSLVNQTNDATAKISQRVGGVQEEVRTMKEKVGIIDRNVVDQKEMTTSIIDSLEEMSRIAGEAKHQMDDQLMHMDHIGNDSAQISESVGTLTGISEETTAEAGTTFELVNDSVEKMGELTGDVKAILEVLK